MGEDQNGVALPESGAGKGIEGNVSLRHLEAFVVVATHKSFTEAARRLFISQPALSITIKQLEKSFGVRLFDRTTRTVRLTADGQSLLSKSTHLVDMFYKSMKDFADIAKYRQGNVSISALYSVTRQILPPIMRQFRDMYPNIRVHIRDENMSDIHARIQKNEVDFGIGSSGGPLQPDFKYHSVFREKFCVACARGFLPGDIAEISSIFDLKDKDFIAFSSETGVRSILSEQAPLPPNILNPLYTISTTGACEGLLSENFGFTIVPLLVAKTFDVSKIVYLPLADFAAEREIMLVTMESRSLSVAASAMYNLVLKYMSAMRGDDIQNRG